MIENKKIKVAFILQAPSCYNKIEPVVQAMLVRKEFHVYGVVVPDARELDCTAYFQERKFFVQKIPNCIDGINDKNEYLNLAECGFDYVFYYRPYEPMLPNEFKATTVSRFAKTCFIPYGVLTAVIFEELYLQHSDFFSALYFNFVESEYARLFYECFFWSDDTHKKHIRSGYPALEECMMKGKRKHHKKKILWTP